MAATDMPNVKWPNNARVALQFVLNFEEGGENCVAHGDEHAETFLSEIFGAQPFKDRHMSMESLYEYGSRSGVWRILNEFERRGLPLTVFAIATALERNPDVAKAFVEGKHEIVCHGLKWIHYQDMSDRARTRAHDQSPRSYRKSDRRKTNGLVHRTRLAKHTRLGRRTHAAKIRLRQLRRRLTLLGQRPAPQR